MITAIVLAGYAALLGTAGAALLRRAQWVHRAPRLGIVAWQALSGSILLAMLCTALVLTAPTPRISVGLAELLRACVLAVHGQYAGVRHDALATIGFAVAVGIALWTTGWLVIELISASITRRRHRAMLAMVGRYDQDLDLVLLDHPEPAAYCLAGRPHRVVLTTATIRSLSAAQLHAVIAHERAHLRERHHLAIAVSNALARAFPWIPAFRSAAEAVTELLEMLADDAATRTSDRLEFAEAMVAMAEAPTPAGALAAGGRNTAVRVRRLIADRPRIGRFRLAVGLVAVLGLLLLPAAIAVTPAATAGQGCCTTEPPPTLADVSCPVQEHDPHCTVRHDGA